MRRWSLLIVGVLLAVALPPSSATPWNLAWQQDVGPGYLTTTPAVDESRVYVRTSGFWTGVERPEVLAFSHEGEQVWSYTNNNTTQHDTTHHNISQHITTRFCAEPTRSQRGAKQVPTPAGPKHKEFPENINHNISRRPNDAVITAPPET
mgnify:CR=1 FL=1